MKVFRKQWCARIFSFLLGIALLTATWGIGYLCGIFRNGFYHEQLMSSTIVKRAVKELFDITIPDDAKELNCFVAKGLDSEWHLSFKLDGKKFDDFIGTLPKRYGIEPSAKRDLPPPVSRQGYDLSWWAPPRSADAVFFFGSGQLSIVYDTSDGTVYLYCFTM